MSYNWENLLKAIYNSNFFIEGTLSVSLTYFHTFLYYLHKTAASQPVVIILL